MALFRQEVVAARDLRLGAEAELKYPVTLRRLLAATCAALLALLVLACSLSYTEYADAPGTVRVGLGERVAVSGQRGIVHLRGGLASGQELHTRELIATVEVAPSVTASTSLAPQTVALLESKKRSLAESAKLNRDAAQEFSSLTGEQLRNLESQRNALRAQLELLGARAKIQESQARRSAQLLNEGYVSAEYDAKTRSDSLAVRMQLSELEQKVEDVEQQMLNARQNHTDKVNQMQADRLHAEQDIVEIDGRMQSAARNRMVDVRVDAPARLAALHVNDGDFVTEDTPLVTLESSAGDAEIVCLADARALGDLRIGAPVKVTFPAFPYLIYGTADGTVTEIDAAPWLGNASPPAARSLAVRAAGEARYRVIVRIQAPERLRLAQIRPVVGMEANVRIPRATHSLFQWLFLTGGPNER